MQIYLLRHGIAENGAPGLPDHDRALVPEGRKKLREILKTARNSGVSPALIVSSPYKRALQTASIAAEIFGAKVEVAKSNALVPDSTPAEAWDEIRTLRDASELLLVGHEPLFGQLFAYLLGTPSLHVDFKKGALARIDVESFGAHPRGVLRWFLAPKLVLD